MEVQGS